MTQGIGSLVSFEMTFLIMATSCITKGKNKIRGRLESGIIHPKLAEEIGVFDVPTDLNYVSFACICGLMRDLQRLDAHVESLARGMEHRALELDANAKLIVISQHAQMSIEEYVMSFKWDDSKFPRARTVQENLQSLLESVEKRAAEVETKTEEYMVIKERAALLSKNERASEIRLQEQEAVPREIFQVAFSETIIAWTHLKAMRTFVQAVNLFGIPPAFEAYIVKPGKFSSQEKKLMAELLNILAPRVYVYAEGDSEDAEVAASLSGHHRGVVSISFAPLGQGGIKP